MNKIKWIVISGAQGTGKSTLLQKIEKELKSNGKIVEVVNEVARSCPFGINEQATFFSQAWIFRSQLLAELEAEYKTPDIILCDRGIYDNLCYLERLQGHHEKISISEFFQMFEIARFWAKKYDYIIHMPLNLDWLKADGVRSVDIDFARDIDGRIFKIIKDFKLKPIYYNKNFDIIKFCNKVAPKKRVKKVILRKKKNKKVIK